MPYIPQAGGCTPPGWALARLPISRPYILSYRTPAVHLPAGRRPYTSGLGLEALGIKTDQRGRIEVDSHFRWACYNDYGVDSNSTLGLGADPLPYSGTASKGTD